MVSLKPTSKRARIALLSTIALILCLVLYTIFKKENMSGIRMPPVVVTAMNIKAEPWQYKLMAVGTIDTIDGVDVTTEIAGMIVDTPFEGGKTIKKGEVLVKLNDDVEVAQLRSLEAQAELAQITFERDKKQFAVQAVSQAQVDLDEADLKSKRALAAQQAAIVAKKTVKAPFSGKLGLSLISVGQFLNPGDKIVTLQSLNPIYAEFSLPQQDITKVKLNEEITLTTDAYPGQQFKGKITTIDPKVDIATRNVGIEATLPNPEEKLLPGMYAQVEITVGKPETFLTLPQAAITYNPYGDIVYILNEKEKSRDGKQIYEAKQRFVTLGEKRGDQVQILKGLQERDLIVTSGQMKLKNGSLVTINNSVIPGNNPSPTIENK
jgi:membrane fusion protein (multidrug efflux system)